MNDSKDPLVPDPPAAPDQVFQRVMKAIGPDEVVFERPHTHLCRMPVPDLRNRADAGYREHRDTVMRPSIRREGIIVPLIGFMAGEFRQVLEGGTRLECAKLDGLPDVPMLSFRRPPDARQRRRVTWLLQEKRKGFTSAEKVRLWRDAMREEGWTQAQLCREFDLAPAAVSKAFKWMEKLAAELQNKVGDGDDGMIPERAAYALADQPPERQRELAARILAGTLTVEELEAELRKQRDGRKSKPQKRKEGPLSVVYPGDWTAEKAVEALKVLIGKLKPKP